MLPLLWCWNTSCSRGPGGSLHAVISPEPYTADGTLDLPVMCKNLPVSRRPFAALLLACAPDSGGAAVVQGPQRSSPHISASRRSMAKRGSEARVCRKSSSATIMSTQNATLSGTTCLYIPRRCGTVMASAPGLARRERRERPAQATCAPPLLPLDVIRVAH
jgi:hypothetical protein